MTRRNPLTLIAALSQTANAWGDLYWDDGDSLDTFEKGDYSYLVFNITQVRKSTCQLCGSLLSSVLLPGSAQEGKFLGWLLLEGLMDFSWTPKA